MIAGCNNRLGAFGEAHSEAEPIAAASVAKSNERMRCRRRVVYAGTAQQSGTNSSRRSASGFPVAVMREVEDDLPDYRRSLSFGIAC
jgi:hypothetical protein